MKSSIVDLISSLAKEFLKENTFYEKAGITSREVILAYTCKAESVGCELPDGWNPHERDLLEKRMGDVYVKRNDQYLMWSVIAEAFHDWLMKIFRQVGIQYQTGKFSEAKL